MRRYASESYRAELREAIRSMVDDPLSTPRVRRIAAVMLVLLDYGADRLYNEHLLAQVAADIFASLEHVDGHGR